MRRRAPGVPPADRPADDRRRRMSCRCSRARRRPSLQAGWHPTRSRSPERGAQVRFLPGAFRTQHDIPANWRLLKRARRMPVFRGGTDMASSARVTIRARTSRRAATLRELVRSEVGLHGRPHRFGRHRHAFEVHLAAWDIRPRELYYAAVTRPPLAERNPPNPDPAGPGGGAGHGSITRTFPETRPRADGETMRRVW
jgi:hypothetical protein